MHGYAFNGNAIWHILALRFAEGRLTMILVPDLSAHGEKVQGIQIGMGWLGFG